MRVRTLFVFILALLLLQGCHQTRQKLADDNPRQQLDLEESSSSPYESHPLHAFRERNDEPVAAAADRYQRRLSANGTVPHRALMIAKNQRDQMLETGRMSLTGGVEWPIQWNWLGPGNIGGRLRPIVFHPVNPNIIYVGSASGGIWKTLDGGSNWFPLDDFLPSLCVSDMAIHPEDPGTLFAATGEGFFEAPEGSSNTAAVRGAGIFVSTNSGVTWSQLATTDNPDFYFVNRLEFDPSDSSVILAATSTGIWRSVNEGVTWNQQESMNALDVKFNPGNALQVVAGSHHNHDGPSYSTDGGLTWTTASGAGGHRQELAWAPSEPATVYAAVSGDNGRIKIWRSTDGGQNYVLQTTGNGIQTWASYNNTLWVDPNDPDFMIVGGVYLYRSLNGGASFRRRFNAVHADMHRIVQHPGFNGTSNKSVYFATDGGIWRTDDVYGSTAVDLNNNLGVTQFYGGGINPSTGHVVGGTQDNGTLFYSGDPQNWDHIFGGDGGYGAADPDDPDFFYGEVQRARIHRSANGGVSSSYIYNGPNPIGDAGSGTTTNFIPFFTLDPNEPNRMLVACGRLWRSNNVKASQPDWFSIKDSIAPPPGFAPGSRSPGPPQSPRTPNSHFDPNSPYNLSTVAVAEGNPDIIWAAHNNGDLYRTANGTTTTPTWTRVDENGTGLPDRWISTVVIDRRDYNHIFVALMGWENDNLWESIDNGTTWTDISGSGASSIPDAPISAFAQHRNLPGWLFVGTDIGIFSSNDNGSSWSTETDGPATAPVEQLLWKDDHSLLAVTHGRGMYLATERSIVPEGSKLLDGVEDGGQLSDLFASDDSYLELLPSPTANPNKQIIQLIVQSTSTTFTPSTFQFRVQAKMLGGPSGEVIQSIRLLNYVTRRYETIDVRPAEINDETVIVAPAGDPARFVHSINREITARVQWSSPSFSGAPFTWTVEADETVWLID